MESQKIPLSIIVITHKRDQLFQNAYKSVIKAIENYPGETEFLVINSSEKRLFNNSDVNLNEVFVPNAITASEKRNIGWQNAKNEWVVYMDNDCQMEINALNHISKYISNDSKDVAAYFGVTEFDGKKSYWFAILENTDILEDFYWAKHEEEILWGPTTLAVFSKNALASVNGFDTTFLVGGEDVDICLRMRQIGKKLKSIPKVLVYHDIETWNRLSLNLKRFFRYGIGEYKLQLKFPEHAYINTRSPLFLAIPWLLILFLLISYRASLIISALIVVIYPILLIIGNFFCEISDTRKGFYHTMGLILYRYSYKAGKYWTSIKNKQWKSLVLYWNFINDSERLNRVSLERNFFIQWSTVFLWLLIIIIFFILNKF